MDDLIHFVSDATGIVVAVLAVVGFLALFAGLVVILLMDSNDLNDNDILKDSEEEK